MQLDDWAILFLQSAGFVSRDDVQSLYLMQIKNQVREIKQALDQITTKEIYAAFTAIEDALLSSHQSSKDIRLKFAEENLLKNAELNSGGTTAGVRNEEFIAWANHGLAYVTILRGDNILTIRHVLRSYIAEPRLSRASLTPGVYESFFKPRCQPIFDDFRMKDQAVQSDSFDTRVWLEKAGWAATGFGAALAASMLTPGAAYPAWKMTTQHGFKSAGDLDRHRRNARAQLKIEEEAAVDNHCQGLAKEFMTQMTVPG